MAETHQGKSGFYYPNLIARIYLESIEDIMGTNGIKSAGKVSETRSYLRWEEPILGINGEGRVSPIIPGCQQITSVVAPDGQTLIRNKIWPTAAGAEGSGDKAQGYQGER